MTERQILILALLIERARILRMARELPRIEATLKALEDEPDQSQTHLS